MRQDNGSNDDNAQLDDDRREPHIDSNGNGSLLSRGDSGNGINPASGVLNALSKVLTAFEKVLRRLGEPSVWKGLIILLVVLMVGSAHLEGIDDDISYWLLLASAVIAVPVFLRLVYRLVDIDIKLHLATLKTER